MKGLFAAMVLTLVGLGIAAAQEPAGPISVAQFRKLNKFIDKIGAKQQLPPPTAQNLGLSDDASLALPVLMVGTDDHQVYFARSELNPNDYVVWTRAPGNTASYMFSTHTDMKLMRALHLKNDAFPQTMKADSAKVQTMFREAMVALAKDADKTPLP
jgi:hypothetical protein